MTTRSDDSLFELKERVKVLFSGSLPAGLCAIAFLAWITFVCDVRDIFEFDSDDGNNVIKGLLLLEGHSFGDEIWSDQPPVFSFLLAACFKFLGATMEVARGVVAFFSAAIVFVTYELLRRWTGHVGALAGAVLLFLSSLFVHLSLSVMIGLPAISLAMIGILLLEIASSGLRLERGLQQNATRGLLLSAGALGALSLGTKLFTAPIVLLTGLAAGALGLTVLPGSTAPVSGLARKNWSAALQTAGLYGAGLLVGGLLAFSPLIEAGTFSGLIEAHALSRSRKTGSADGARNLARFLTDDGPLFAIAIVGMMIGLLRQARGPLFFLCWFLLCFYALLDHHPVWTHHRTLLTIPAAVLAGYGIGEISRMRWSGSEGGLATTGTATGLVALTLLSFLLVFPDEDRAKRLVEPEGWSDSDRDWQVFDAFKVPASKSKYVATARPTHAFRAGRPIPPNLAVTSSKRFVTKLLTPERVAEDVEKFAPETILLSERWPAAVRSRVKRAIKDTHLRVQRSRYQRTELWVEKKLAAQLGLEEQRSSRRTSRRSRLGERPEGPRPEKPLRPERSETEGRRLRVPASAEDRDEDQNEGDRTENGDETDGDETDGDEADAGQESTGRD